MNDPKSTPVERMYLAWDEALSNNDAAALLALYAPDAIIREPARAPPFRHREWGFARP
jgi:ketosteroid isomerase-like protein